MDHIPTCSDDLAHPILKVPYFENGASKYDDLGFLNFPLRAGIDQHLLSDDREPNLKLVNAAPFLQAWLWFGLLGEALQVGSRDTEAPKRASSRLFISAIAGQTFVSTRRLQEVILEHQVAKSPEYQKWQQPRLANCLGVAKSFIHKVLELPQLDADLGSTGSWSDTCIVLLLAQILCETLQQALFDGNLFELLSIQSSPSSNEGHQYYRLVDHLLLQAGWCPKNILRLPRNVAFRYHLSFHRQMSFYSEPDHLGTGGCCCVKPSGPRIGTEHTHPLCQCGHVPSTTAVIALSMAAGEIPLFRFQRDGAGNRILKHRGVAIQSAASDAIPPYVAISHVRSAGLGSESGNSLPLCQLSLVQSLANELVSLPDDDTLFWIDTLCLPLDRRNRKSVIHPIRDIFRLASHVLVLDPPLYQHTFNSAEEALVRIRYSSWTRRIWTLEEGFVARNLVFRFSHGLVSLETLILDAVAGSNSKLRGFQLLESVTSQTQVCSDETLEGLLVSFRNDIATVSNQEHHVYRRLSERSSIVALYKRLRLGYLLSHKFRYFVEEDERQLQPEVWRRLREAYEPNDIRYNIDAGSGQDELESLRARLEHLSLVDFST